MVHLGEEIIPLMVALKEFTLDISKTKVATKGVQALFKGLHPIFKNLNIFKLFLQGNKVAKKQIEEIMNLVDLTSMPKLKTFNLVFYDGKEESDATKKLKLIQEQLSNKKK